MSESRPKVIYWNNIPAPYMVDRWNAVVEAGEVDLEVWLSARIAADRSWDVDEATWKFGYRYLPTVRIAGRTIPLPTPSLCTSADVVVSLYAEPWFLGGWLIHRARGVKTAFWVEPTFDTWIKRYRWKETFKRWLFPRVNGLITTGPSGREFCLRYNAPDSNIHEVRYGVDVDFYRTAADTARPRRDDIRRRLALRGVTFLYIVRFWYGKGLDTLLDAFSELRRQRHDVSLLLVGDGPEESRLQHRCRHEGIEGVTFHPFMQRDELPEAYVASDVFVFPSLGDPYGLVVDEAMACSLPIIATSAAGEIETRVFSDVNGYIVEPGSPEQLFRAMSMLANSPEKHTSMGLVSSDIIATNTPDNFAQAFEQAIASMLA